MARAPRRVAIVAYGLFMATLVCWAWFAWVWWGLIDAFGTDNTADRWTSVVVLTVAPAILAIAAVLAVARRYSWSLVAVAIAWIALIGWFAILVRWDV